MWTGTDKPVTLCDMPASPEHQLVRHRTHPGDDSFYASCSCGFPHGLYGNFIGVYSPADLKADHAEHVAIVRLEEAQS